MKTVGIIVCSLALIVGLSFGAVKLRLEVMRMYGAEVESVKTDIYRENKSYVEGTVRELRNLQVDYLKAADEHKPALRSLILHRANELDWDRQPSDVREFLHSLKD